MANILDIFQKGLSNGMFTYAQNPLNSFENKDSVEDLIKKLPPAKQDEARQQQIKSELERQSYKDLFGLESPDQRKQRLQVELDAQKEMLKFAQGLGKESVETAYRYSLPGNISKTISQSFNNLAAMRLAAGQSMQEGGRNILNAYANMQLPASSIYQPRDYFK